MSGKRSRPQNRATAAASAAASAKSANKKAVTNLDDEQREDPTDGRKKRATVPLAKDADQVLRKCRELRDQLRNESNDDDDGDDDDAASSKSTSTSDDDPLLLNRSSAVARKAPTAVAAALPEGVSSKDIVEVAELSSAKVLEGMETIALRVAHQVLNKQGFSLDIPSRAASNQIYIKEWDRIVLGSKRSTRSFLNVKESRKSAITLRVMQLLHAV
jgi:hypothetical protein